MDLIGKAKSLQTDIAKLLRTDDLEQLAKKFDDLDALYRVLNSLVQDIKLIRQNCYTEITSRLKKIRSEVEILDNPAPTAADIQQLQSRDHGTREVAPGIALPVVAVATEDFIPDSPLYYIRSSDEFAVRINGSLIRGRIRDFSSGASSVKCRRGASCREEGCQWGHPTDRTEDGRSRALVTWSPGSWIYTDRALEKKNLHMRHIGSRNSLLPDIQAATRSEMADRAQQTAHDLLVQLAIEHALYQ
jgi:hypothetical protein